MRNYEVYGILKDLVDHGITSSPKGEEVTEIIYFQSTIEHPWSHYKERNYPVDYFKREMQWYLGSDPFDNRICKHATMWKKLVQQDGSILSNYGYYWFNQAYMKGMSGFEWVVRTLRLDPDSRQAYIPMNNFNHAFIGNKDFVCTKGIQFRIADGHLYCHAAMRSSDAIFGLATDLPCFWTLWSMVGCELDVPLGEFIFSADSLHIYERHYDMVDKILQAGPKDIVPVEGPLITDAYDLITEKYESPFGQWLTEVEL